MTGPPAPAPAKPRPPSRGTPPGELECRWSPRGAYGSFRRLRDHMLDRQAGVALQPLDQVATEPPGAGAREGRDDDLVDALVGRRLHRSGVRVRMDDLAVGIDALRAELRERTAQPSGRLRMLELVGLR